VGNSYQALEDGTAYSYLINDHWRPGVAYPALALDDPTAAIPWPISLDRAEISAKDLANPRLDDVPPMDVRRQLILGADGQLGRALARAFPEAGRVPRTGVGRTLDVTDPVALDAWPWADYDVVLNAAGYTDVDGAETADGRAASWRVNAHAPAALARLAREHRFTLVHFSTDYVFDGRREQHDEAEPFSPLGVYGQSKAAGDLAVAGAPAHYLLRTSWVVGEGRNFVRTMQDLARRGVSPDVVDDQLGRLTFADELARATRHLVDTGAPYGTYHVSNGGPVMSWADIAQEVFHLSGRDRRDVGRTSTEAYGAGRTMAPRPRHSTLDLAKLEATGFRPEDALVALRRYCTEPDA
jgi:dTDP-4-dehydrorhamnose 3,5-epimerase